MVTRKVQVTGGSTYTVSLPKDWAKLNDVSAGSVVKFHSDGEALLLSPNPGTTEIEGSMDVSGLEGEQLTRAVMTMYVSGFDRITLEAPRLDAAQSRIIRHAAQDLVGLEVTSKSADEIVLRDLLDLSELSVENSLTRMRLFSLAMVNDAMEAVLEGDDELARDVVDRDDEVDRLWFLISRVFRTILRNPVASTEVGLPRETCFDYQTGARQLERIADHATKIADRATEIDELDQDLATELTDIHEMSVEVPDVAIDALLESDPADAHRLANDARSTVASVDERAREISEAVHDHDSQNAQAIGLVVDSIGRTADYGGNIAEAALQKAAPRP
ncbi:phosphate signaling complex PhoU family protein [Halorientalis pallida]|uniref:Phosphate uptake regulator PhoU n=1 Tax=Halorientalis pallida TaxID=2479928 RepID=A0A498KZL0_9EURY|nr:phosphate uptake regulator PhoU [Halorientalis pallida]RXK47990.1 phosphate uptake regulator PhoU [Halorientalis pallida]